MSAQVETAQEEKVHLKSKINELYVRVRQAIRVVRHQLFKKIPNIRSKPVIVAVIAVIVIAGAIFLFRGKDGSDTGNLDQTQTYVAKGPRVELNKKFNVPIRDSSGKESGSALVVNVSYLERTEKLLYRGKPLIAREGKDFLVINLEVENSTNNRLTVRPVDFFRLIDYSGKSYAPDIQTDPIKVEPQSSKKTRTIYIVGDEQNNIKLMIGEIKGDNKETVEVTI